MPLDEDSAALPVVPHVVERALRLHAELNNQPLPVPTSCFPDGSAIELPETVLPPAELGETLATRRSRYRYAERRLRLPELAALLGHSLGVQRFARAYGAEEHPLSRAEEAGGLGGRRCYVAVRAVDGIAAGLYRYDPAGRALITLRHGDPSAELTRAYLQPEFAELASVTLVLTARLDVAFAKYPLRHYRTLHVDAGIAVQNLYLVGTALGLSCCAVAGFDDANIDTMLRLPRDELATMVFAVGPGVD